MAIVPFGRARMPGSYHARSSAFLPADRIYFAPF
jgi:hypothetical protein